MVGSDDIDLRVQMGLDRCEALHLGELGDVEAGLRQLRRSVPLETEHVSLPSGSHVVVPTLPEALRVKAFLVLQRNQVRDYLDVVALAERRGLESAAKVLARLDRFYDDRDLDGESVATALVERLSNPDPRDARTIKELPRYKGLEGRWHDWPSVVSASQALADATLGTDPGASEGDA